MIILFIVLVSVVAVALFLRGEGDNFGSGNSTGAQQKKFSTSDKNYFL